MHNIDSLIVWAFIKAQIKKDKNVNASVFKEYIETLKIDKVYFKKNTPNFLKINYDSLISKTILLTLQNRIVEKIKIQFGIEVSIQFRKNIKQKENYFLSNFKFSNYILGKNNKEAFYACKNVALNPGAWNNFLFLCGQPGTGKTHLLGAINNFINKYSNKKVLFINCENFGNVALNYLTKNQLQIEKFKHSFLNYDCLLFDDIQLLRNRQKTNQILFSIVKNSIEHNKQIVVSSDLDLENLSGFERRLISRFHAGLSVFINPLNFETAKKIIIFFLKKKHQLIFFSDEALNFLAKNFASDARKIKGVLNRIIFYKNLNNIKQKLQCQDLISALPKNYFRNLNPILGGKEIIKKIQDLLTKEYQISYSSLNKQSRIKKIVQVKHLGIYFSRNLTNLSLNTISSLFELKDHSSAHYAIKKIKKNALENNDFNNYLQKWILDFKNKYLNY